MGKALSGELSCPCDRSCFFIKTIPKNLDPSISKWELTVYFPKGLVPSKWRSVLKGMNCVSRGVEATNKMTKLLEVKVYIFTFTKAVKTVQPMQMQRLISFHCLHLL